MEKVPEKFQRISETRASGYPPEPPGLLQLPQQVQKHLLDHLTFKEILDFRLTCRGTLQWVEGYSTPYLKKRLSSIEINLCDSESLESFINSVHTIPFSRFNLKLVQDSFNSKNSTMQKFIGKFGHSIHHLCLNTTGLSMNDEEFKFFSSMTSLKSLDAKPQLLLDSPQESVNSIVTNISNCLPTPSILNSLERFTNFCSFANPFYPYDILASCPRLKYFYTFTFQPSDNYTPDIVSLTQALNKRRLFSATNVELSMPCIFLYLRDRPGNTSEEVDCEFLKAIGSGKVTISNATTSLIKLVHNNEQYLDESTVNNVLSCITKLNGISTSLTMYHLPQLKEFQFFVLNSSWLDNIPVRWNPSSHLNDLWPNLLKIHGTISKTVEERDPSVTQKLLAICNLVLKPRHHWNHVTHLRFSIECYCPQITPEHFSEKFPSLQSLHLRIRSFNKENYTRLFGNLGFHTKIRSLQLDTSVKFDDETFIGLNPEFPVFSTLSNLRELTLSNGAADDPEGMIGITDTVFTSVFSSMPLTRFVIRDELLGITEAAITALAEGEFGRSISKVFLSFQYFPLDPLLLSLKNKKLRAYQSLRELAKSNKLNKERNMRKY